MKINWFVFSDLIAVLMIVFGIFLNLTGGAAIDSIYWFVLAIAIFTANAKMERR